MTQTIDLSNNQKKTQFQIDNTTSEAIPVSIKVYKRIQKIDGTEEMPETNDLKVFPPQLIIPKGEKRTIRVDWISKEKPTMENSYRIVAEQVPVDINEKDQKSSGIKMLLRYMAALYVNPGKTKAQLSIVKIENTKDKTKITVQNEGSKHQHFSANFDISFKVDKKTIPLPKEHRKIFEGQNILAKSIRIFEMPLINGLSAKSEGTIKIAE
jgi:fimbrial chaperone protein